MLRNLKQIAVFGALAGILALLAGLGFTGGGRADAALTTFELQLTGAEENPPVRSPGSAFARLTFDDVTRALQVDLTVSGLSPNLVTAAHIHRGARGVNGPIIHNISTTGFMQASVRVTLSEAEVADLRAGNLYLNVHSVEHPGGFARAQILLPEAAVAATVQAVVDAWNRRDVEGFLSHWTESGFMAEFDASIAEGRQFLPEFIGDPPIRLVGVSAASSGSTATAIVDLAFGEVFERNQFTFVLDGGAWKVSDSQDLPFPIPAGVRAVDLEVREYAFIYDRNAAAGGNFAFSVRNTGQEPHEAILIRINRPEPLSQIIRLGSAEEGPPPGIDDIGGVFLEPGDRTNMVLTRTLSAGRYGLVCFVESPDGVPHALLGMFSEFNVGGATSGGVVRPPSTGDAGLLDGGRGGSSLTITLVLIGAIAGFGLLGLRLRVRP